MRLIFVLAFILATCASDDVAKEMDIARADHAKALANLKESMLAEIDKRAEEIRNGGLSAERKVSALDEIKDQRDQFSREDKLPTSPHLKTAVETYKGRVDELLGRLDAAYGRAIDAYTKAKDDARAKALLAERKSTILGEGHELVGDWWYDGTNSVGMLEKWTITKIRSTWSVTGRYYTGDGRRLLGTCTGRDYQFEDGMLKCKQIWSKKPDQNWPQGHPLGFKVDPNDPEALTMLTSAKTPFRLVKNRR
jgi:hypothetical protein